MIVGQICVHKLCQKVFITLLSNRNVFNCALLVIMASSVPVIVRLLASSVSVAHRAGKIVRDVMSKGELGIIEKVAQ